MGSREELEHLLLPGPETMGFRYPGFPRDDRSLPDRDAVGHADMLTTSLREVVAEIARVDSELERAPEATGHLVAADIVPDSPVNAAGLGDKRRDNALVGLSADGAAIVHFRSDDFAPLERKLRDYANPDKLTKSGRPRNAPLFAPIERFRLVTLADLSDGWLSEETVHADEIYWVELWLRGGRITESADRREAADDLRWFVNTHDIESAELRAFRATEHDIYLAPISGSALRQLPLQVPDVYRITPPEVVDTLWLLDHQHEITPLEAQPPSADATIVALLDTGVSETHPLLREGMLAPGRSVVVGVPSAADTHGHGTRMAGIAGFANLGAELAAGRQPRLRAKLQNIRVLEDGSTPTSDLPLWPERTAEAVAEAEQDACERRVFNLALGAPPPVPGELSPWAVAVDSLAHNGGAGRLLCVAAGNVLPKRAAPTYPDENLAGGITTPAEAVNALTVGAITSLCSVDGTPGVTPVAPDGGLSPFSRCDFGGNRAIKPDVVLEGGNWATDGATAWGTHEMSLITTSHQHAVGPPLTTTCATSAATAGISGLIAEVWEANPDRSPESIRGLVVHSARWTPAMATQLDDRRDRRRAFGYGVPNSDRSSYSFRTRPTLILETILYPERRIGDGREMHFVRLPMPDVALQSLGDQVVELSVTLSYFTEPNENRLKRYGGAGLRWAIQRPLETEQLFRQRINRLERDETYAGAVDDLAWEIGQQARSRGTVQSDRCRATAQELTGSRAIGVWPVGGWWRGSGLRDDAGIRYSLIITLDAGDADLDLYTEVATQIQVLTEIEL